MPKRNNLEDRDRAVTRTFSIPQWMADEIENAIDHLAGPPLHLRTNAEFARRAFSEYLEKIRRAHNGSRPFGPAPGRPKVVKTITR